MTRSVRSCAARALHLVVACAVLAGVPVWAQDAAALRARHGALMNALSDNAFDRPLVVQSNEAPNSLQGEIYARIDQPFARVGPALQGGDHWCDIMVLHPNVKDCRADAGASGPVLKVGMGRARDQAQEDPYELTLSMRLIASRPDYLQVALNADQGPLGTSDYRIVLEVVALGDGRSFIHLSYAYRYGIAAGIAMRGYLATLGRNKVGFSVIGRKADGAPQYIGGTRAVVERNTMRYYLAIEAYIGALGLPPGQRFEQRLAAWFTSAERYPVQLHELERDEYLTLKRAQAQRAATDG